MKKELDCENKLTLIISLSKAFNCSMIKLLTTILFLKKSKLNKIASNQILDFEDVLYNILLGKIGTPNIDSACYFHFSKTVKENNYIEGILPLNLAEESVWNIMIKNSPNDGIKNKLEQLKKIGIGSTTYLTRVHSKKLRGPNSSLIKDINKYKKENNHRDFRQIPELMEDICNSYFNIYKEDLKEFYSKILISKVVKFRIPGNHISSIKFALLYLYKLLHFQKKCSKCFIGYTSEGDIIPIDYIIYVQDLNYK